MSRSFPVHMQVKERLAGETGIAALEQQLTGWPKEEVTDQVCVSYKPLSTCTSFIRGKTSSSVSSSVVLAQGVGAREPLTGINFLSGLATSRSM